jgi:protoheme IX farnesyltransferase
MWAALRSCKWYLELTKPKVTLLNLLVAVTSFILAEFPSVDWTELAAFLAIGYLAVGGSCALNCYYDLDIDALMGRTSRRAIPSGKIRPKGAFAMGTAMLSAGAVSSYLAFGPLTTAVILAGAIIYVGVYTKWLKRSTRWSVVIGGISGSLAAVYGWTATGSIITLVPLLIAALDFLWTPGHLWGLAIKNVDDYRRAHVPMLPVLEGAKRSSSYILAFNAATIGLSFLFPALGMAGLVYTSVAAVAGCCLLKESVKLGASPTPTQAFKVFFTSMPYLALLMAALLVDKVLYIGLSFAL